MLDEVHEYENRKMWTEVIWSQIKTKIRGKKGSTEQGLYYYRVGGGVP